MSDTAAMSFDSGSNSASKDRAVLDWLINETHGQRYIDNLFVDLCERLRASGVPLARATMHFRTNNPEWLGARVLWRVGLVEADIVTFGYGIEATAQFLLSPAYELYNGAEEVRQDLRVEDGHRKKYPLFAELRAEGMTDYIAWPLQHTLEKRHIVTFASDAADGFSTTDVQILREILPILAMVSEVRIKNILARTLLQTYVGPHASEEILAGATTRGSGVTLHAAILICDLRDFTSISNLWPRDDVIELLNGYFDALCEPIERHGGEILKFMGDGLLAVFPLSQLDACKNLLIAIREAELAMIDLNIRNEALGRPVLRYGMGVHVGDVMYGNIGSRKRLDFTAIGPAVNVASRLETLTKTLHRPVLLSQAFVDIGGFQDEVESLGPHMLRGMEEPIDVFALQS